MNTIKTFILALGLLAVTEGIALVHVNHKLIDAEARIDQLEEDVNDPICPDLPEAEDVMLEANETEI